MTWYVGVGIGVLAAVLRVTLGLLQSSEPFAWGKAGRTLAIAVITGGITGGLWENGAVGEVFLAVFAETVTIDQLIITVGKKMQGG